jgi:hypothetical protein
VREVVVGRRGWCGREQPVVDHPGGDEFHLLDEGATPAKNDDFKGLLQTSFQTADFPAKTSICGLPRRLSVERTWRYVTSPGRLVARLPKFPTVNYIKLVSILELLIFHACDASIHRAIGCGSI